MDIPNKQLDDTIAYSLETQTYVSTAQKSRAWEQLREKAAQQVILAPYAVPPKPRQPVFSPLALVQHWLSVLVTDETMYHRAAVRRDYMHRVSFTAPQHGSQFVIRFHMTEVMRYSLL